MGAGAWAAVARAAEVKEERAAAASAAVALAAVVTEVMAAVAWAAVAAAAAPPAARGGSAGQLAGSAPAEALVGPAADRTQPRRS